MQHASCMQTGYTISIMLCFCQLCIFVRVISGTAFADVGTFSSFSSLSFSVCFFCKFLVWSRVVNRDGFYS